MSNRLVTLVLTELVYLDSFVQLRSVDGRERDLLQQPAVTAEDLQPGGEPAQQEHLPGGNFQKTNLRRGADPIVVH